MDAGVQRESAMMRDLRAGMTHATFLRKYGKPMRVERRQDGLYRLHYDSVTVTFDEAGVPIEISHPIGLVVRGHNRLS